MIWYCNVVEAIDRMKVGMEGYRQVGWEDGEPFDYDLRRRRFAIRDLV